MGSQGQAIERTGVTDCMKDFLTEALREIMGVTGAQQGALLLYGSGQNDGLELAAELGEGGAAGQDGQSFLSLPLKGAREKRLGLITLRAGEGGNFSEQDTRFASAMAAYACVIAVHIGVAEGLRKEKQRLEEQKELFAKYTSVGKLAAGIVHEINNPLDGIIRFTNMLLNLQESDSLPRGYLLEIKGGLAKIESVTRSLLQFSHHVERKSMLIRNYVDIPKLLEESLISCEAKRRADIAVRRDIRLHRRLLDMGLSQVFTSVIQNAFDAMPGGGVLEVSAQLDEGGVVLMFRDSGRGIASGEKEKIFEPFYTDKNDSARSGLGLAKCREIVGRYNGVIEAEGAPGRGSTFTIRIPGKFLEHD